MPRYLTGAEVIADARLRIRQLSRDQGILILEGGDDFRSVGRHARSRAAIIACGEKWKVLDAYDRLGPGEDERFLFLVDCDYDVPCGRLKPARNLVLTSNVDMESDILDCDVVLHLLHELVPPALLFDDVALQRLAAEVTQEALELASAVGRFRLISARDQLGLNFQTLRLARIHRGSGIDLGQLATMLQQRSEADLEVRELLDRVAEVPSARSLCQGKDLMGALAVVIRERFRVPNEDLRAIPRLVRAFFDSAALERWPTLRYIRRWETSSATRVLR